MTYKRLDITLLYIPPYLRGVAITLQPQMEPLSVWERAIGWIRGWR